MRLSLGDWVGSKVLILVPELMLRRRGRISGDGRVEIVWRECRGGIGKGDGLLWVGS